MLYICFGIMMIVILLCFDILQGMRNEVEMFVIQHNYEIKKLERKNEKLKEMIGELENNNEELKEMLGEKLYRNGMVGYTSLN